MADLPTAGDDIGGYRLLQPLPGHDPAVARWSARSLQGPAELFVGGAPLLRQARGLPGWGPFPPLAWGEQQGFAFVAVPGRLAQDLPALGRRLAPGACLALAWHVVAAVAELHENGGAHGALASGFVGLDEVGRLAIRPALDGSAPADPDPSATAQATDCLALGQLLDVLRVELIDDAAVGLLLSGLRRERARLRLSPGRAVRQAMAALLARHPAFELALIGELGPAFSLARLPTAPPPARPRPQATPSWERQEEEPIRAPAQVFLGQAPRPSPPLASPPAAPTWTDDEPGPTDDAQDGAAHDETPAEAPAETPAEALDDEAVRDEDTSLEPVPEHVAADIVEEVAPLEAESGAWMAVGAHIAGREEVPGDLPGGQTLAPEEVEALLSSDVGGGATLAPDEFPELLPPQAHEATQDPATEATIDTSLGLGEELSSAMVGVVAPSHARDEIPSQALQIVPVPQPARLDLDDESAELDLQAEREAAEQAEREAAEQAEREAAEQAEREAAEQAEREAAEQAEREARARAEQEARARAEQEARAQAEQEARARAEREAREQAEQEARARAEREAREQAEREEQERAAREALARDLAREAQRAAEGASTTAPRASRLDLDAERGLDLGGDAPKWAGVRGVTGDPSREKELGKGKWTEEARSLDEVAKELPTGPARAMDLDTGEGRGPGLWIALAVVAVLVLALLGWRVLAGGEPAAAPAPAEASASAPGAQVVQARPEGPTVTVITRPPGGRIFLDGADLGPAPAVVPVPTDAAPHELCVVDGDRRTCRQLTGAALALTDPYLFSVE